MGNWCGMITPEGARDRLIRKKLRKDEQLDRSILKILLLGTGESGKSTIFKQARSMFGHKYTDEELLPYKEKVFFNIIGQMKALITFRRTKVIPLEDENLLEQEQRIMETSPYNKLEMISPEVVDAVRAVWNDVGIQKVWERKGEFQVFDSLEYFLEEENYGRIVGQGKDYIPSFQDALQCRDKTTGIYTEKLKMDGIDFDLYDVGGQRPERRKWIQCFDNVTTIIFVTAINEYDQTLYEEEHVGRIAEALEVWEETVNKDIFQNIGFIMFLNKWDIFREKVCKIPFRVPNVRNDDYDGTDPMEFENGSAEQEQAILQCYKYMEQKFISKVDPNRNGGIVESHPTVATDNRNMDKVFSTCKHQLLFIALNAGGFNNPDKIL